MKEVPKTVFVTKYALTAGIREAEVQQLYATGTVKVVWPDAPGGWGLFGLESYALTHEKAIQQAEALRNVKLNILEMQTKKLKELKF